MRPIEPGGLRQTERELADAQQVQPGTLVAELGGAAQAVDDLQAGVGELEGALPDLLLEDPVLRLAGRCSSRTSSMLRIRFMTSSWSKGLVRKSRAPRRSARSVVSRVQSAVSTRIGR